MKLETNDRHSVQVLFDCIELQRKKGSDYNSAASRVKQADYYPNGVYSLLDIINAKVLRMYSVLAKMEAGEKENFESLQDSCKDLVNYGSFLASWLDGRIDGQNPDRDIFNKPKVINVFKDVNLSTPPLKNSIYSTDFAKPQDTMRTSHYSVDKDAS